MSRIHVITFVAASIVAVGCEQATEPIENRFCVAETYPGLEVQVSDAHTGRPLAATATGTATRTNSFQLRAYTETLKPWRRDSADTPVSLAGIYYREGTYSVVITHEDYHTWIVEDVQVAWGKCRLESLPLSAFLVRQ